MDMNSTRCFKSKRNATTALTTPLIARLIIGTWVRSLIRPMKAKSNPSFAIEYIVRGREYREPKRVVVIPHRAPILTRKTSNYYY